MTHVPASSHGGPASGAYLPVADASGVTVDTTTYNDPIRGSGKLTTLVFPATQRAALAVAIAGDAFPRWLLSANAMDGLYIGPGTSDAYADGVALTRTGDAALLEGKSANISVGASDANEGPYISTSGALRPNFMGFLSSDAGAPTRGGNVGDIYFRTDGGIGSTIYRCTVAGTAGSATWLAIL